MRQIIQSIQLSKKLCFGFRKKFNKNGYNFLLFDLEFKNWKRFSYEEEHYGTFFTSKALVVNNYEKLQIINQIFLASYIVSKKYSINNFFKFS